MRRGAKWTYTRRTAKRDARVEVLRTGARVRPLFGGDAETPYTRRTATRDARVAVLGTSGLLLALARPLASSPPALWEGGASTSAPGEIKIVSEKHGVKKRNPLEECSSGGYFNYIHYGFKISGRSRVRGFKG